jgi:hypothetical protein
MQRHGPLAITFRVGYEQHWRVEIGQKVLSAQSGDFLSPQPAERRQREDRPNEAIGPFQGEGEVLVADAAL